MTGPLRRDAQSSAGWSLRRKSSRNQTIVGALTLTSVGGDTAQSLSKEKDRQPRRAAGPLSLAPRVLLQSHSRELSQQTTDAEANI